MFWWKLCGILLIPSAAYVAAINSGFLSVRLEGMALIGAVALMFGGLLTATFHEMQLWFQGVSDAFGSAAFASPFELWLAGLFRRQGVILGRHFGMTLRFREPGHLLTIAPTRAGKGTCAVIPNLLDYLGSTVTIDIKGENFAIAGRRRRDFGKVYRLAPFEAAESDRFNPMDMIRDGDDAWDDAAFLAEMLIVPSGSAKSLFFENEAKALLTGLILYAATELPYKRRNLAFVRHLLTLGTDAFETLLDRMHEADSVLVRRTAESFGQKDPKLQSSIIAEAQSHTLVFDSERVERITSASDFSFEELKKHPTSVFLVIPPEHLSVYRPLLRLFLGLAVTAMTRQKVRPSQDVLFLVDEFANLGRMKPLEEGVSYLAGYGVKLWLFAQDLGQLESVYGANAARSIVANSNLQTFSNMDEGTLAMISRMLGRRTVRVSNRSKSRASRLSPTYDHFNTSTGETGRPLLTPDEIRHLGDDRQILFLKGRRPILAKKIPYFRMRRFKGLWDQWIA